LILIYLIYFLNFEFIKLDFTSFNNTNDKNIDYQMNQSKNYISNNFHSYDFDNKDLNISLNDKNSKYKKNILFNLDNIAVVKYEINPNIPLDPIFYDILCINCYECIKANEVDFHSEYCIVQSDEAINCINNIILLFF